MDHDNNDLQSQNFQLVGEDNSKFPSSLRFFSLPKFELDDHLQIHLRFDGLVDQESLLGVQDQVQNNWIEDFSTGNSVLELRSSAAESCSISMQKNVWSEATSSESVEMLLKSVGEDDKMNKRMDAAFSESQGGLNNASDNTTSCNTQDDSFRSKEDKAVGAVPVLLPGQCEEDLSRSNKDATAVLPGLPEMCDTLNDEESESRIFEVSDEVSKGEKANNPRKLVAEQCALDESFNPPSVESFSIKEKIFDNSCSETRNSGNLKDEFVKMRESNDHPSPDSFVAEESKNASMVQIDLIASSVTILANDDDSPTQKFDEYVSENHGEDVFCVKSQAVEDGDHKIGSSTLMRVNGLARQPSEGHTVENKSDCPENASSLEPKNESTALLMEGYIEHGASEEDGLLDNAAYLSRGDGIGCQIPIMAHEESPPVTENQTSIDGHSVEVCNMDNIQSTFIDSLEQVKEISRDANVETNLSLKNHRMHDEILMSMKNTEVTGDCVGKQPEPAIPTEGKKDACNHPAENKKLAEVCTLCNPNCGMQEADKKEDNNLGIVPPELTFQGPRSLGIQRSPRDEVIESDEKILRDTANGPRDTVQEADHSPGPCVEHSEKTQTLPSQDAQSLENSDATVEPDGKNSNFHSIPPLPENQCSVFPGNLDGMNHHVDGENLQETLPQSHTASISLAGHVEDTPARVATQVESGDAVNLKGTTLQSMGFSRSPSETFSLEDDDSGPRSLEHSCSSPIVISCAEPCSDEFHRQELKEGSSDSSVPLLGNLPQIFSLSKGSEENKYTACDTNKTIASEEDRSFTFKVGSLTDTARREAADQWKPLSNMQSNELLQDGEGRLKTSSLRKVNLKGLKETPGKNQPPADVANKSARKDKSKAVSRSMPERLTASKRKTIKESLLVNQTDQRNGKLCSTPVNKVSTMSKPMQLEEIQHTCSESSSVNPSCFSSSQTSKLPDSNTVVALFHQPFTDKQQVQLRAQIFVYGSLIQGAPPDEACMISAFGNTDGKQSAWEGAWHIAVERFRSQKSSTTIPVTLPHSHSGIGVHEQISNSSSLQSKTHGISVNQTSKGASPIIFNSSLSLPSQLMGVSTHDVLQSNVSKGPLLDSNEIFSPLHVSHSSHGKQYVGNGNAGLSQASPIPLVASSQTSILDGGAQSSKLRLAETFQVTPIRNSSIPYCSNLQFKTPSSFTTAGVLATLPAPTAVQVETMKKIEISGPEKHATNNQKSRRKKSVVSEVPTKLLPHSQPHTELDPSSEVTRHPPTMITMPTVLPVSPSTHFPIIGSHVNEQKAVVLEETSSKTGQAKLQAEDAAAVAVAAVRHSEGIWSQLSAQKNSGLVSETEMNLAYAAVAAAAASSIAKAAAAAAMVARDAALQAKLMADEAFASRQKDSTQHSEMVHMGGGTNLNGITLNLFVKGKDETSNSTSLIAAAKEAARRRVAAASASAKHAENLDMIVKAAELATVSVSQAGAIIAMGEPLPFKLSDLMEAGPEGYQKFQNSTAGMNKEKEMDLKCAGGLKKSPSHLRDRSLLKEKHTQKVTVEGGKSSAEELKQPTESQTGAMAVLPFDILAPETEKDQTVANLKANSMQEGSLVEVFSNENGLRRVWYSANVLNLKDGKAYVCYHEHPNAGSDKLKEWIPLEGECDKPPRIRIAHPTTVVKYEGTRKRRRAAVGNYVWAIGDRVDAWIHNGWCEGIVTEKCKEDETKLAVHFPAGGDTSVVSIWHLRPSLIWKDSQWVEWSRPRENNLLPHEGDTPQDKRQKLIRTEGKNDNEVVNIGVNKHSTGFQTDNSRRPEESRLQVLSEKDKTFSLGESVREESNSDTTRIKRIGLQKEGSRVVFGIPRPGKKRKFMEVSKHYVKENPDNVTEGSDSIKFAKYLVPQSSRGWKNTKADSKRGQNGELKPLKPKVARSIRSQSLQTRNAVEGEGAFLSTMSTSNDVGTASHEENSEKNMLKAASVSNNFEEDRSESPHCPVSGIVSSNKKNFDVGPDVGTKEKVAPSLEKANNEEIHSYLADHPGKIIFDTAEPRRSSRKIQPTSRLLEGLQSSVVTAKVLNLAHEKGGRASQRHAATPRGRTQG